MCLRRLNTAGGLAAYIQQVHQPELERCVDFFRLCHRITDTHFLQLRRQLAEHKALMGLNALEISALAESSSSDAIDGTPQTYASPPPPTGPPLASIPPPFPLLMSGFLPGYVMFSTSLSLGSHVFARRPPPSGFPTPGFPLGAPPFPPSHLPSPSPPFLPPGISLPSGPPGGPPGIFSSPPKFVLAKENQTQPLPTSPPMPPMSKERSEPGIPRPEERVRQPVAILPNQAMSQTNPDFKKVTELKAKTPISHR